MAVVVEVHGGPFDGDVFPRARPPRAVFVWLDGRRRMWARAGRCRYLHRVSPVRRGGAGEPVLRLLYAATVWRQCAGCGAFHRLTDDEGRERDTCALCGSSLRAMHTVE